MKRRPLQSQFQSTQLETDCTNSCPQKPYLKTRMNSPAQTTGETIGRTKKLETRLDNLCEQIGPRIAELRKPRGLSMTALAKAAGVACRHVSRIERGIQPPRVRTLLKILTAVAGPNAISDRATLARRVRLVRKKLLMTQLEFASLIGAGRDQLSEWECGSVVPSVSVLRRIGELLGVGLDFFYGGTAWAS